MCIGDDVGNLGGGDGQQGLYDFVLRLWAKGQFNLLGPPRFEFMIPKMMLMFFCI